MDTIIRSSNILGFGEINYKIIRGDDQNVVIARSFTDQDLQMSPKKI